MHINRRNCVFISCFHYNLLLLNTGNNFVWCWLLFRCHWMAYHWHGIGGIWVYCAL
ncbi:hypothetical protein Gotur_004200 [Gossypium turneri]